MYYIIYIKYCDVTCSYVLIIRNNFYIINNDFDNDYKIVPFTYIGVGAIPDSQTISFSKLKENLLQQVHGYVENN